MTALILVGGVGLLIVLHELAHLLAARVSGVRAEEFTLGYGPPLLRTRFRGTLFSLRLLVPLGGYVKLAGMDDRVGSGAFGARSVWRRAAIVLAGPAANLLVAFLLLFALFTGDLPLGEAFEVALRGTVGMAMLLHELAVRLLTGGGLLESLPGLLHDATGLPEGSPSGGRHLRLLTLLSLCLGLFNLLPVMPLDGGRLPILAAELLRGRPLPQRTVGALTALGATFMAVLALLVTYEDLGALLSRLSR